MIKEYWNRLHAWGQQNAPYILEELNVGATFQEIEDLQDKLEIKLPDSLLESLQIHNGEKDGHPCRVFADYGEYHSTIRIVEQWNFEQQLAKDLLEIYEDHELDVEGPMKTNVFNRKWIPFMDCNGDGYWALDLDPADGGTIGQIIEIWREDAAGEVIAKSFEEFLENYISSLENGEFTIENGIPSKEH